MVWAYRTLQTGIIEVDPGTGFEAITLPRADKQTAATEGFLELAKAKAAAHGCPLSWVLAVIYAESGGNPTARNACCAGLMALSLVVYKITEAEAFEPAINVELGAKTLGDYRKKGHELPEVASMYNAGPSKLGGPKASSKSPWGMVENMPAVPWTGYIEKVVRASNYWRAKELGAELGTPGGSPLPGKPIASRRLRPLPFLLAVGAGLYLADRRLLLSWLIPGPLG